MKNKCVILNNDLHYLDDIIQFYKHQDVYKVEIYADHIHSGEYDHILTIIYPECKIQDLKFNSDILNRNCYIEINESCITTDTSYHVVEQAFISIRLNVSLSFNYGNVGIQYLCGYYSIRELYDHYKQYYSIRYLSITFLNAEKVYPFITEKSIHIDLKTKSFDDAIKDISSNNGIFEKTYATRTQIIQNPNELAINLE